MIPSFNDLPDQLKKNNPNFFNASYFHGDISYKYHAEKRILEIHQRKGNIVKNLMADYIGDQVDNKPLAKKLITQENKTGKISKIFYRVKKDFKISTVIGSTDL